jgi:hypothetical protein
MEQVTTPYGRPNLTNLLNLCHGMERNTSFYMDTHEMEKTMPKHSLTVKDWEDLHSYNII